METQAVAERAKREVVDKDGRIQQLSQFVEGQQEEQTRAMAELQKMRGEKDHLMTEALSINEVRQELEDKVAALLAEREALQSAHDKLAVEMQSKDHTLANLAEARGALTAKVAELESSVADRNYEVDDRDRQLSVAHNRILGLEARLREQVGFSSPSCPSLLPVVTRARSHTRKHTHMHARSNACTHTHTHIHSLSLIHTYTHSHTHTHACTHTHTHMHIHSLTHTLHEQDAAHRQAELEADGKLAALKTDVSALTERVTAKEQELADQVRVCVCVCVCVTV